MDYVKLSEILKLWCDYHSMSDPVAARALGVPLARWLLAKEGRGGLESTQYFDMLLDMRTPTLLRKFRDELIEYLTITDIRSLAARNDWEVLDVVLLMCGHESIPENTPGLEIRDWQTTQQLTPAQAEYLLKWVQAQRKMDKEETE